MRNSIRCIALMLVLCLIFSTAGTATAANKLVDDALIVEDYDFANAGTATLQTLFCMDARGFLKALAFESAAIQERVILYLLVLQDPQSLNVVKENMFLMARSKNEFNLTQSEQNLLSAMQFRLLYLYGLGETSIATLDRVLQYALNSVSLDEYSTDLGLFLSDGPYAFIVALSELEPQQQEYILQQLSVLNGTVGTIRILESMQRLVATGPQDEFTEIDPNETVNGFTEEQNALFHAILECLKDRPPYIYPQEPVPEELAQWQTNPVVPRTDFDYVLANQSFDYHIASWMLLDTAGFIQAFSRLPAAQQETLTDSFLHYWSSVHEPQKLLYNIHSYLSYGMPDDTQQTACRELVYALLRHGDDILGVLHDLSVYFVSQPEDNPVFIAKNDAYYHFSVEACFYPEDFIAAYSAASLAIRDSIGAKVKSKFDPTYRQALIDTVYDLYKGSTLTEDESLAAKAFLDYQGSGVNPIFPYGVDPNAPPAEPTDPTNSTDTTDLTDATDPTATEPPTPDASEDTDSATGDRSHLLRTVLLSIAAFALGIPIGAYYVNRKGRTVKTEETADPPDTDEEEFL